jgi:hypothetical protein
VVVLPFFVKFKTLFVYFGLPHRGKLSNVVSFHRRWVVVICILMLGLDYFLC